MARRPFQSDLPRVKSEVKSSWKRGQRLNIAAGDPSPGERPGQRVFLLLSIVRAKILVGQYIRAARHECGLPFDSVKYEAIKANGPRRPAQLPITL